MASRTRDIIDVSYNEGYLAGQKKQNELLDPMIREIHDRVYSEAYEKGAKDESSIWRIVLEITFGKDITDSIAKDVERYKE